MPGNIVNNNYYYNNDTDNRGDRYKCHQHPNNGQGFCCDCCYVFCAACDLSANFTCALYDCVRVALKTCTIICATVVTEFVSYGCPALTSVCVIHMFPYNSLILCVSSILFGPLILPIYSRSSALCLRVSSHFFTPLLSQ